MKGTHREDGKIECQYMYIKEEVREVCMCQQVLW